MSVSKGSVVVSRKRSRIVPRGAVDNAGEEEHFVYSLSIPVHTRGAERTAHVKSIFAEHRAAIDDVPLHQRSVAFLQDTCLALGLDSSGSQAKLIKRLRRQRAGKAAVVPMELYVPVSFAPLPPAAGGGPGGQRVGINTAVEVNWYSIPKDVARAFMAAHVDTATLFAMLHVSRSVCADALIVLRARALQQWGERGTPMALSAQLFYAEHGITRLRAAMKTPVHSNCRCMLSGRFQDRAQTIRCHIARALETHGSMEGLAADRARRAKLLRQRRQERAQMSDGAEQRYATVAAMMRKHGLPLCFIYDASVKKCLNSASYRFIFEHAIWTGTWSGFFRINNKLKSHVEQQNPLTLTRLEQMLVKRIVPKVSRHFTQLFTACIEPLIPHGWMREEHVSAFMNGFCLHFDKPAVMTDVNQMQRVIHEGVAKIEHGSLASLIPMPRYLLCVRTPVDPGHFRMYHVDHLFFGGRTLDTIIWMHFQRMRPCNVSLYGLRFAQELTPVHLELAAPGAPELNFYTRDWLSRTLNGSYAPATVIWMDFTKVHSDDYIISAALAAAEIK